MKKKLASFALCLAVLAGVSAPASAAFSVTSVRQGGVYYYSCPPQYRPPISCPAPTAPTNPTNPTTPTAPTAPSVPNTAAVTAFEKRVVELVNEVRAQNGLKAVSIDTELVKVARIKSQDMRDKRYFDHQSPTYGSPFDMLSRFGVSYRYAGENIAMGYRTAELVMNGWMNSPGHRANILKAAYTHIGVGHVADGNYWTQLFISK